MGPETELKTGDARDIMLNMAAFSPSQRTAKRPQGAKAAAKAGPSVVIREIVRAARSKPPSRKEAQRLWRKIKAQRQTRVILEDMQRQSNPAITAAVLHAFAKERDEIDA